MNINSKGLEEENGDNTIDSNVINEMAIYYFNAYGKEADSEDNWLLEVYKNVYEKYEKRAKNIGNKESNDTGLEKLLDLTIEDVELQFTIKQSIEYKIGFVLALWGVLLAAIFQAEIPQILIREVFFGLEQLSACNILYRIICFAALLFLSITGARSLLLINESLVGMKYKNIEFYESKQANFKCAVDNRDIFVLQLLQKYTNIWKHNEDMNNKKAKMFDKIIKGTGIFIISIIVDYIFISL